MPFNPLDHFTIHFETILIQFLRISGFWYKWSPVYPAVVRSRGFFIGRCLVKTSEQGHAYIKQFGVSCSSICSTSHCCQSVARISIMLRSWNYLVTMWEGDLSLSKVYEGPLGYAERSPLTHFIQPYRALETLFSEYYYFSW